MVVLGTPSSAASSLIVFSATIVPARRAVRPPAVHCARPAPCPHGALHSAGTASTTQQTVTGSRERGPGSRISAKSFLRETVSSLIRSLAVTA